MAPELVEFLPASSGSPGADHHKRCVFGTKKGKVSIEGQSKGKAKIVNCKVTFWDMNPTTGVSELRFLVPKVLDPGTYPLTVTNKVGPSAVVQPPRSPFVNAWP